MSIFQSVSAFFSLPQVWFWIGVLIVASNCLAFIKALAGPDARENVYSEVLSIYLVLATLGAIVIKLALYNGA
jgi:hypothetical protein